MERNNIEDNVAIYENATLNFVKRWINAFRLIIDRIGIRSQVNNEEFVDKILLQEDQAESQDIIDAKRKLIKEMCDDIDDFYAVRQETEDIRDLNAWFENRIKDSVFAENSEDIDQLMLQIEESIDEEMEARTELLKREFESDNIDEII